MTDPQLHAVDAAGTEPPPRQLAQAPSTHTPRSARHGHSTPERCTGLLGGSDSDPLYSNGRPYRGGRPYLGPLSAHDQQRLDDNYLEADDRSECYVCMEPLHPHELVPCEHRRHANILLDCCMCNAHRGPEAEHDIDDDDVKRRRRGSPLAPAGRSGRTHSSLLDFGGELMRNSDVYVARSTLNLNSTAKQRGRRGFRCCVVDAGWGLFAARDFRRDELVLDYRFVDGKRGVEVDRLDAGQLEARYPDPLQPPTHVLRPHGSGVSWDTLRCRGVGGFANSHTGHQNCLFRGSKIHVGSRSRKAGTELFLNYSYDNSYEWADGPEPEADFHHHPRDFSFHRPGTGGADVAVSLTAAAVTANVAAAMPPAAEQCICNGVRGTRCINLAQPDEERPHRNHRWCANCKPVEGNEKCGCLCGGCEVHEYELPQTVPRISHPWLRPASDLTAPFDTRHLMGSEMSPPVSAAYPPTPVRCVCRGVNDTRCINVALVGPIGPYMWCAECRPVGEDEKCGCLCGGCEVHDYNSTHRRIAGHAPRSTPPWLRPAGDQTAPLDTFSLHRPGAGGANVAVSPASPAACPTAVVSPVAVASPTSPASSSRTGRHKSPPWDRLLQMLEEGSPLQTSPLAITAPAPPRQCITHLAPPPPRAHPPPHSENPCGWTAPIPTPRPSCNRALPPPFATRRRGGPA